MAAKRRSKPKITVRHKASSTHLTVTVRVPRATKKSGTKHKRTTRKLYGAAKKAHAKKVARRRRRRS